MEKTTSVGMTEFNRWFKSKIAKVMMWNRCLDENEILQFPNETLVHYDFKTTDKSN